MDIKIYMYVVENKQNGRHFSVATLDESERVMRLPVKIRIAGETEYPDVRYFELKDWAAEYGLDVTRRVMVIDPKTGIVSKNRKEERGENDPIKPPILDVSGGVRVESAEMEIWDLG